MNATNEKKDTALTTLFEPDQGSRKVLDFSTTLRELRKTVDPHLVRQRADRRDQDGKTHLVDYVEWHTVADILDEHAPDWQHSIRDIRSVGDLVVVTVAITIRGVTREGVGTGKAASETGIKKAEHDGLKRAAVKFGIARELYKRELGPTEVHERYPAPDAERIVGAIAKCRADMITAKQLGMIHGVARETSLNAERECQNILKCSVDELSRRGASELIEHLLDLQQTGIPIRKVG